MDTFSAIAEPTRRAILEMLARRGPLSATQIYESFDATHPAISQHLKVLREANLVLVEKRGQQRIYHLNPVGLAELRGYVEGLWDDVLRAFGEEAERMAQAGVKNEE